MNYTISTDNDFLNDINMIIKVIKLNNFDAVDVSIHFKINEKIKKKV